jgi:hypothetical protein
MAETQATHTINPSSGTVYLDTDTRPIYPKPVETKAEEDFNLADKEYAFLNSKVRARFDLETPIIKSWLRVQKGTQRRL